MDHNVTETKVKVWVPRSEPLVQLAYKCLIRTRTICTHMGFFGGKGIVGDIADSQTVSIADCQQFLTTFPEAIQKFELSESHSGIWSTNNTLTVEYVWCCQDHCTTVRNLIVEEGQLATFDGIHLSSNLGDLGGCKLNFGYCQTPEGTIVWQPFNVSNFCPYEAKEPAYDATVSDQHVIIHDLQVAFSISHSALEESNNCGLKFGFVTHQGPILVFNDKIHTHKYFSQYRYKNVSQTLPGHSKLSLDPENLKFEYLKLWAIAGFRIVWLELCQLAAQQLTFIHHLIQLDATLGARALLQQNDVFAVHAGEALFIWKCQSVIASTIYWNYEVNKTCYQYLPVLINDSLYFAVPGSKDLVSSAPAIDCNHHHHGVYLEEGHWRTTQGLIHVSQVPVEVVWGGHWKAFSFDSPTLFHDKMAGIISTFGTFKTYVTRLEQLHGITNRLIDYTASFSTDPYIVKSAIAGIGEGIGDIFVGAGTGLEHVLRGAGHGVGDLVNGLLKGPIQLLLNIILCILIISIILAILYFIFRKVSMHPNCSQCKSLTEEASSDTPTKFVRSRQGFWGLLKSKSKNPLRGLMTPSTRQQEQLSTEIVPLQEQYTELPKGTGHCQRPPLLKRKNLEQPEGPPLEIVSLAETPDLGPEEQASLEIPQKDFQPTNCDLSATIDSQTNTSTPTKSSPQPVTEQQIITKAQIHNLSEACYITSSNPQSHSINWPPQWNNHIRVNTGLPSDLAKVPLIVGRAQISALLDTGSSISLIPKHLLPRCHLGPIQPTQTSCLSLTGHSVEIEGMVVANITIHETTVQHPLYVMQNNNDFILGTDLMARFRHWNLDFSQDKLYVAGIELPLLSNGNLAEEGAVRLHSDIVIPPNVQVIFPAKVDSCNSQAMVFEPDCTSLGACGLKAARLLVCPQNGLMPVRLLNFCSYAIQLQKGTCLGHVQPIPDPIRVAAVEIHSNNLPELWQQIDLSTSVLTDTEKQKLITFLKEYQAKGLFAASDYDLGCTDLIQHPIDTGDHPPVKLPPYRVAIAEKSKVLDLISKMESMGAIRPSASPWSSPIVIVPKKDGSLRFCCDYRKLNQITKRDIYPIPRIDDLMTNFASAKIYSSVDMQNGFWQIKLRENDCEKDSICNFLWVI